MSNVVKGSFPGPLTDYCKQYLDVIKDYPPQIAEAWFIHNVPEHLKKDVEELAKKSDKREQHGI